MASPSHPRAIKKLEYSLPSPPITFRSQPWTDPGGTEFANVLTKNRRHHFVRTNFFYQRLYFCLKLANVSPHLVSPLLPVFIISRRSGMPIAPVDHRWFVIRRSSSSSSSADSVFTASILSSLLSFRSAASRQSYERACTVWNSTAFFP